MDVEMIFCLGGCFFYFFCLSLKFLYYSNVVNFYKYVFGQMCYFYISMSGCVFRVEVFGVNIIDGSEVVYVFQVDCSFDDV